MRQFVTIAMVFLLAATPLAAQQKKAKGPRSIPETVRSKITVTTDVEYAKASDVSLKLDIYQPKTASGQPRPCIVWIHGGGWQGGNKSSGLGRIGALVASGDFVGVSVGYRLTDVASWPAQIHDCKAAIRYIRANASKLGIDPQRIGLWGSSAGGHLVSLLGTSGDDPAIEGSLGTIGVSSRVACVVDYCGPSDFSRFAADAPSMNQPGRPVYKLFGGPIKEKQDLAQQASPVTYVSADDPPFLIVHGTVDKTVPIDQAIRLHEAQKKAGSDSTFIRMVGGGHGIGGPEIESRVTAFLEKHLLLRDVAVSAEPIELAARPAAR